MLFSKLLALVGATLTLANGDVPRNEPNGVHFPRQVNAKPLQDIVTWDEYSLKINGKRLQIFSGEIHPYRIPVSSLLLDIFQKIKALGFNCISFYSFWGLHEPKRGDISFEGIRDLQPLFDAAMKTGLYVIARPGPYINAETTGGGFPGWGTYTPGLWRTSNESYVEAYQLYIRTVGKIIAANQITKGGPVILAQVENEYSLIWPPYTEDFTYEARLISDFRAAGIVVPITTNDVFPGGVYDMVDLYGHDGYPGGFDCTNPGVTPADAVPEWYWDAHQGINPEDPYAVYEFQGGAFDGWGGSGFEKCSQLLGTEFQRVFYKNQFASSNTLLNIYMIYGGTNWGGISHPGGYTSYDYGAAIAEDRRLREKYYDLKLQAYFRAVSSAWATSRPINIGKSLGSFTGNNALKTTQTLDVVGKKTGFYTVRQNDTSTYAVQHYKLTVPTSLGELTIPVIDGASLALNGKDSKVHVVDYQAGSTLLPYSTAEIVTWATIDGKDIVLLYGNKGELHETAVGFTGKAPQVTVLSGDVKPKQQGIGSNTVALQYTTTGQSVISVGSTVLLYILDRENAYPWWVLYPPATGRYAAFSTENPILVKGGYLLRTASIRGSTLSLTGDLNTTTSFEIIAPAGSSKSVLLNGSPLPVSKTAWGSLTAQKRAVLPNVPLPDLSKAAWKYSDSLPEIQPTYSDAAWTSADHATTANPRNISTPTVLYAGDYGYHTGNLIWRGHFTSTGAETGIDLNLFGGTAFAYSAWLNSTFLGSWVGDALHWDFTGQFKFPTPLTAGQTAVLTILSDTSGYDGDWWPASDSFKGPRGIMSYNFTGTSEDIKTEFSSWKVTGNFGGESYVDKTRGPFNEGGLFAERQGWHLPGFDDRKWAKGGPVDIGIAHPGVNFFRTTFNLNIPDGVDYPLSLVVGNTSDISHFRSLLFVNGYQFGKYVNHVGPQAAFPVPQGVLNYKGSNTLAVSLWAADTQGAKLGSLALQLTAKIESSIGTIVNLPAPGWSKRVGVY